MSYDELMMFIYEPNSNEADIPWLNSLQIHAEYSMMFKKNMLTFQEHSNNCMENLDIFNSEPQIDTFFESIDSITEPKPIKRRQASKETKTKNLPKRRLTEEKSTVIIGWQSQVYCYKCHLVIENKQQYNCIQCNHSYHKICFMTNDLICLDCNISRRLKYYDPESLGLILNTTLKKVLNDKEASNCLARIRCPVNLYYISLKVETGKYKCIPDFIDDFNSMLHFCWINPSKYHIPNHNTSVIINVFCFFFSELSHLKSNAEKVLEKVLQELRKIAVVKK